MLRIRKHTITPYHPETNGNKESRNKILAAVLAKHCENHQRDWDFFVSTSVMEYNSSIHQGTNCTPYFLVYGQEPRNSFDIKVLPRDFNFGDESQTKLMRAWSQGLELARRNIDKQHIQNKQRFDEGIRIREMKVNNKVLKRFQI